MYNFFLKIRFWSQPRLLKGFLLLGMQSNTPKLSSMFCQLDETSTSEDISSGNKFLFKKRMLPIPACYAQPLKRHLRVSSCLHVAPYQEISSFTLVPDPMTPMSFAIISYPSRQRSACRLLVSDHSINYSTKHHNPRLLFSFAILFNFCLFGFKRLWACRTSYSFSCHPRRQKCPGMLKRETFAGRWTFF